MLQKLEDYLRITVETYNLITHDYVETTRDIPPQPEFDAFCRSVAQGGQILDAGCAWGRDCREFSTLDFSVIGVDLSCELLKIAISYAPACSFLLADLRNLPLPTKSVDGIWCCATLLHLKHTQISRALVEFHRVLRPGATCYIQVKKGLGEGFVGGSFSQGKPRFFSYFQEDELSALCVSSGFHVVDVHVYDELDRYGSKGRDQEQLCFLIRQIDHQEEDTYAEAQLSADWSDIGYA